MSNFSKRLPISAPLSSNKIEKMISVAITIALRPWTMPRRRSCTNMVSFIAGTTFGTTGGI